MEKAGAIEVVYHGKLRRVRIFDAWVRLLLALPILLVMKEMDCRSVAGRDAHGGDKIQGAPIRYK